MKSSSYILAGWMVDGSGAVIQNKVLLQVENGMIRSIDREFTQIRPDPAIVTDLSHCTIMPPLVDSHVHLFMSGSTDQKVRKKQLIAGYDELKTVIAGHLQLLLGAGVLAIRDGGDRGAYGLRYKNSLEPDFPLQVKLSGRAWHKKDRYGALIGRCVDEGESLSTDFLQDTENTEWVKLVNSGLNSLKTYAKETACQFSLDELTALVRVAGQEGKKVMVHANGRLPVKMAVQAGCHSVEHGFFMGRENLQLMADMGTVWVPTAYTMKAYIENMSVNTTHADKQVINRTLEHQLEQMAMARELGVQLALGTDSGSLGVIHGEAMIEEMKLYQRAGFSLAETLACATYNGAKLLGLTDRMGLLQVGSPATFLVNHGTPEQLLKKSSCVKDIFIDGAPIGYKGR